ncbi:uncharacterized protein [Centruroides vittatus]|uniref:uncharacterized protein n=1 Tax=Centruroides vittatus TaxID=120091 RepID=UPI00350F5465
MANSAVFIIAFSLIIGIIHGETNDEPKTAACSKKKVGGKKIKDMLSAFSGLGSFGLENFMGQRGSGITSLMGQRGSSILGQRSQRRRGSGILGNTKRGSSTKGRIQRNE